MNSAGQFGRRSGLSPATGQRRRAAPSGFRRPVAALALAGLVGCVDYHSAPIDPAHSVDEFAARRLDQPRLRGELAQLMPQATATWPPQQWDRAELLTVALLQNPQLAVARLEVKAALSHEITAAETPNPDLTLQSEYARHDAYPWLYGVSLNWLLRTAERRRLDNEIARLATGNARLQLMDQAWAVRSALAGALSDWESARRRLTLLGRLAAAQDRFVALEKRRVEAGEDASSELVVSEQARIQIEQQQAELHTLADASQAAAAKALGLPPQALDGMALTWPEWGEPPPVDDIRRRETREQALLSRADIAEAIGDYAAAETKLQQSIARQYPQFTLSPGFYWDHGIAKFPFDVGFALPLNRNKGEIAEARTGRELAGQRMLALQADIYGEIESAERAEHISRESTDAALRQLAAVRRQQQQADLGVRLGAVGVLDQVGAEILVTRAELEVAQMRTQLQAARNTLEDVLHTPLSGPELALAKSLPAIASGSGS